MAAPRTSWGIDVGNRALKAVKLVRGANGIRIDDVAVIEHEHILSNAGDNKESLIQAALNQFVQTHATKGAAIAIGVSGQQSFARFIKLPPVEPKKIPEIVRFEAIQQIPFPLDEVEWSYQLFSDESSPDVEVGIFAMRRELVNRHIEFFSSNGLDVNVVQMSPLAVYNAMQYDQRLKGSTMIIDIGAENTDLIIAEGESVWLRSIPIGGNNFTESLTKSFKLRFEKAEELKRNAATSKYARQILQAMRPVFADLVSEIQRSIGFYASVHRDSRISRVVALGGTFRLPGLQKYLQQNLQLEVHRLDRLAGGAPDDARTAAIFNENLLSTVPAYGLALQAMGEGKINSSLLPQKIRRERMWRDKTKWFATAAAVTVVAVVLNPVAHHYYYQMQYDQTRAKELPIQQAVAKAKELDSRWDSIEKAGSSERKTISDLYSLEKGRTVSVGILEDIVSSLPDPGAGVRSGEKDKILKAEPTRGKRRLVKIEQLATKYDPDLGTTLALSDQAFNANESILGAANNGTAAPAQGGNRNPMFPAGRFPSFPMPGGGPGGMPSYPMPMGPGAAPKNSSGGDSAAPAEAQHGYIVVVRFTTPFAAPGDIGATIQKALLASNPPAGAPQKPYRIERVQLASASKIAPPDKNAFSNNANPAANRFGQPKVEKKLPKGDGTTNADGDLVPTKPPVPLRPGMGNGGGFGPGTQGPDEAIPFVDSVTGEPMKDDSQFTLVVAIRLDPPPPPKPEPGKEGETVPPKAPASAADATIPTQPKRDAVASAKL